MTAEVSGGYDFGWHDATQTYWCARCEKLEDIVIEPIDSAKMRYFHQHNVRDPAIPWPPVVCPICHLGDKLSRWDGDLICPKCGGKMKVTMWYSSLWD
jgi:Zn ribbon nucleic-acid-binding protein